MSIKRFAVIGHPIGHTMSPFIHKRLFELAGISAEYGVLDIAPEALKSDYNSVLKELDGYNITIPHKQSIIPLIDEIDSKAKLYGSVNTVLNRDGKAKGFTTDPDGFLKALEYARIPLSGRVVILGCGGAARTMAYEAALAGAKLEFAVREQSVEKAEKLAREIKTAVKTDDIKCVDVKNLSGDIKTLINATPVGMSPNTEYQPVSDSQLEKCENVFDAIYNPLETRLIGKAKANGSRAEGGMSMLVWQAVVSHRHWDGSTYDVKDIEKLCADAYEELKKRL
ncbi:MAG: shikimate dehydrogenase [Ruminococcus sp.]|nr:shikimate dehydrogenase [Ruminococcus sp.]